MGLDMYLSKKTYVQNWDHTPAERRHTVTVLRGGVPRADVDPTKISYVEEQVAYWRKANAIHKWFVDHCQGGVDDCRNANVSVEDLRELVELCRKVLKTAKVEDGMVTNGHTFNPDGTMVKNQEPGKVVTNPEELAKLLPSASGFFFGSTDYDQWYLEDVKQTIEMLEPYLECDTADFEYHSSW